MMLSKDDNQLNFIEDFFAYQSLLHTLSTILIINAKSYLTSVYSKVIFLILSAFLKLGESKSSFTFNTE